MVNSIPGGLILYYEAARPFSRFSDGNDLVAGPTSGYNINFGQFSSRYELLSGKLSGSQDPGQGQ